MAVLMMNAAARIQSQYRGFKVRKEIAQKAEQQPGGSEAKPKISKKPEERAIVQFKDMVKSKGLTLEAFFRVCDLNNNKVISYEEFRSTLAQMRLQVGEGQVRRLMLVFDEDCNGSIQMSEYYNCLEGNIVFALGLWVLFFSLWG